MHGRGIPKPAVFGSRDQFCGRLTAMSCCSCFTGHGTEKQTDETVGHCPMNMGEMSIVGPCWTVRSEAFLAKASRCDPIVGDEETAS